MANIKYLSYDGLTYLINKIKESTLKTQSESISYSDLCSLVENGELIPGKKYRINDYYTIINKDRNYIYIIYEFTCDSIGMTDGIGFDIVVTALSTNKLSEEAFAIDRDNDYFSTSTLSAWKIWYTIYNDITKYSWANPTTGKGVIYRMIDEYGNDIPYDFKSIKFYNENLNKNVFTFTWIDEDNNVMDASIFGNDGTLTRDGKICGVKNNIIKPLYSSTDDVLNESVYNKQILNNIVFISDYSYGDFYGCNTNIFGNDCCCNIFSNECCFNIFGNQCCNNSFGDGCKANSFGDGCCDNSFGECCALNSFGIGCWENIFGGFCFDNSFGNGCYQNIIGDECSENSFGNGCNDNSFGVFCESNIFGNGCYDNSLSDTCWENSFGNNCGKNSFGNACSENSFGNGCNDNSLGDNCDRNSFGNGCDNNSFRIANTASAALKAYCWYNRFDDGCSYNIIWNNTTANSSYKLQNIHVKRGVEGTSSAYNMINVESLNNKYCTTVAKTSSGDLLIYCEEDYISNGEIDTIFENIFI